MGDLLDMKLYLAGTAAEGGCQHRIGGLLYSTKEDANDIHISCKHLSGRRGGAKQLHLFTDRLEGS